MDMENKIYRYYSQYGEDHLIWRFFNFKSNGFFFDIGAFDGRHISNSYSFARQGWKGICVEAHPYYYTLCKENRPESHCAQCACVSNPAVSEISFKTDKLGLFSGLKAEVNDNIKTHYARLEGIEPKLETVTVPAKTASQLLNEYSGQIPKIDFVSIDVEGAELDVLRGFDLNRYQPRLFVIEATSETERNAISESLASYGYQLARINFANSFYVCSDEDAKRLADIEQTCVIERQIHPMGIKYTIPAYVYGQVLYRGELAYSALREAETVLQSYDPIEPRMNTVAHLKDYIQKRKEKVQALQSTIDGLCQELNAVREERNDKIQQLTQEHKEAHQQVQKLTQEHKEAHQQVQNFTQHLAMAKAEIQEKVPLLSIITVTYNAADELAETIASIRAQNGSNFEYIVVDGNSTDHTYEIIAQNRDLISQYLREKDKGIYDAMNKGLVMARGRYVQFLNAGDTFDEPGSMQALQDAASSETAHVVYGNIYVWQDRENRQGELKAKPFTLDNLLKKGTSVLCHQAMCVRKDAAPLYDLKYPFKAELAWYFDICERFGDQLVVQHVPVPVVNYYLGGFGYKHFIKNRIEWVRLVRDRYGYRAIYRHRLIQFLYNNSMYRYPGFLKYDWFLRKIFFQKPWQG